MNEVCQEKTPAAATPLRSRLMRLATLAAIIFIGVLFRFTLLAKIPNGLFCDEASAGYDAYSLLTMQRDRYGEFLPLFTRSFGDYPESSYRLITAPFIAIFGLNEFATRFTAALAGVLTVLVLYFLAKELFNKKVGLLAAGFLAIQPWHIQFSRTAFNAILFPLFFCLGLLFFNKALKKPPYLIVSAIMFFLSLYTYSPVRVFAPLFLVGLSIIYLRQLWDIRKETFIAAAIFLSLSVPLVMFWVTPHGMWRAHQLLCISLRKNALYYLSYFNPQFLFLKGDPNLRHCLLKMGHLYLFESITVLTGLTGVLLGVRKKQHQVLLLWLVLFPIPAALTEPRHAIRSIIGAPLFSILSAYGIFTLASLFKSRRGKAIFIVTAVVAAAFSVLIFSKLYFLEYPKYSADAWQYGMREAIAYAEKSTYDSVVVSGDFLMPDVFILFYTKLPPLRYYLTLWNGVNNRIGKYNIAPVSEHFNFKGTCLFIIKPYEIEKMSRLNYVWDVKHVIKDPEGNELIKLLEVRHIE